MYSQISEVGLLPRTGIVQVKDLVPLAIREAIMGTGIYLMGSSWIDILKRASERNPLWGLGLQGVVTCLASRKTGGFDSHKFHFVHVV